MALDPDAPLHKQPGRQGSLKLAPVISQRLDELCALVNRDGNVRGTVYRQDLIAALIALAPETVADLEKLIEDYMTLKVRHALVGTAKDAKVIELRPAKPGRRTS